MKGSVEGVFTDLENIDKMLTDGIATLEDAPKLLAVRDTLVRMRRDIAYAAAIRGGMEQRTIKTLHDMSVRKEALTKFYERATGYFKGDLLERLIFIQAFAALDASEGHGLAWLYTDDFNKTLIQYQEAKEHDVD